MSARHSLVVNILDDLISDLVVDHGLKRRVFNIIIVRISSIRRLDITDFPTFNFSHFVLEVIWVGRILDQRLLVGTRAD